MRKQKIAVMGQNKKRGFVAEWVNTIVWAGLIAIVFRSLLLEPFNIPSGSMIPTLQVGDHLFVSKWSYGYSRFSFPFGSWNLWSGRFLKLEKPARGDVAVFRKPGDNVEYVKRIVGMPGDTVQMKAGRLYVNGILAERSNPRRYVIANISRRHKDGFKWNDLNIKGGKIIGADFNYTVEYKDSGLCNAAPYECLVEEGVEYDETLPGGVVHKIVELSDTEMYDNTPAIVVPDGHYFMMGDDRDRSADSRAAMGPVPSDNLIGKVWFIWYSHNYYSPMLFVWDWFSKMRWGRFGAGVK